MNLNFTAGELVIMSALLQERIKFIKEGLEIYTELNLDSLIENCNDALKNAESALEKIENRH